MANKAVGLEEIQKIIDEFAAREAEFLAGIDFIVGVSRGGLVPAALLAAKVDKPLVAVYINKQDEIFFDRRGWIAGKNILVIDDIVRSGKTLRLVKDYLQNHCALQSISFFALFKLKSLENKIYNIKSFSREISEDVVFPWDHDRK